MDLRFPPRHTVLITGGSRGIGAATARAFAAEGVERIHLVGRNPDKLDALRHQLGSGTEIIAHPLDLSDPQERAQLRTVLNDVDILVNNAGAIPQGALQNADINAWQEAWDLKLWGYVELTRAALAVMTARGSGVILNIIGVSGERPDAGYLAGSMANSALMTMTRTVGAYSLDHGVRVLGINPGPVETDRIRDALRSRARSDFGDAERWADYIDTYPGRRMATADEVADAAVFLASPRSSYTSGCIMTLDGGMAWRGKAL